MVVSRLVARWLPPLDAGLGQECGLEATLLAVARVMFATALEPEALALHRLVIAEIGGFRNSPGCCSRPAPAWGRSA